MGTIVEREKEKEGVMAMAKPWERQPEETSKAYAAFCAYRDLGPERSLAKAGEVLGKNPGGLEEWSSKNEWVKRSAAWDDEQDRIARQAQLKEIAKMRERHAKLASDMLVKAAAALEKLPEDEIKAADVSRMVDVASKLERISRGDVGDVIEDRNGGDAVNPVQIYIPDNNRGRGKDDFGDLDV